jgi:hypothetical protein
MTTLKHCVQQQGTGVSPIGRDLHQWQFWLSWLTLEEKRGMRQTQYEKYFLWVQMKFDFRVTFVAKLKKGSSS